MRNALNCDAGDIMKLINAKAPEKREGQSVVKIFDNTTDIVWDDLKKTIKCGATKLRRPPRTFPQGKT